MEKNRSCKGKSAWGVFGSVLSDRGSGGITQPLKANSLLTATEDASQPKVLIVQLFGEIRNATDTAAEETLSQVLAQLKFCFALPRYLIFNFWQ